MPLGLEMEPYQLSRAGTGPAAESPSYAHSSGSKVKLRLHYKGRFVRVDGAHGPTYKYAGGEVFNDSITSDCQYSELCRKFNEKFGDTVSFRYQPPGEDLDPDTLVMVTDNDDLQELFEEHAQALARPTTPQKTFRIKVFVSQALQFETEYGGSPSAVAPMPSFTAGEEHFMDASIAGVEGPDFNGESWCTDELSSSLSAHPSSDTEVQVHLANSNNARVYSQYGWARAAPRRSSGAAGVAAAASAAAALAALPAPSAQAQLAASGRRVSSGRSNGTDGIAAFMSPSSNWAAGANVSYAYNNIGCATDPNYHIWQGDEYEGEEGYDGQEFYDGQDYDADGQGCGDRGGDAAAFVAAGADSTPRAWQHMPAQHLDDFAFTNISKSVGRHDFTAGPGGAADDYTEDDFDVPDDPYGEKAEENATALGGRKDGGYRGGNSLFGAPVNNPADTGPGLGIPWVAPAAASVAANALLARVNNTVLSALPSHISAFGDSIGDAFGASIQLPSHISAFGDSSTAADWPNEGNTAIACGEAAVAGGSRAHLQRARLQPYSAEDRTPSMVLVANVDDIPAGLSASKLCITQEFSPKQDGSLGGPSVTSANDFTRDSGLPENTATTPLAQVVKLRRTDVNITRKIGEGAFGEVSQAQVFPYGTVAIKWLKKDRFAKYSESFQQEAEVLSKLNHPNIIRMYGLVIEPDPSGGRDELIAGIMTEFVRGGSLSQQLKNLNRRLTLRERAHVAWHAVLGMAYLHDQKPAIIHFDLKPDNLLVDGQGDALTVKVADFGLSKHKFNSYVSCRDLRGTLPYMAPELVSNPNQVCEKCDVWSMGVVMWEMVALQVPFQDLSAQQILVGLMHGSLHLKIPQDCEVPWRELIELCLETNPEGRPSFRQLAAQLEIVLHQQAADTGTLPAY